MPRDLHHVLRLDRPEKASTCLVADSPHSGCEYPDDFGYACDLLELRKAEDAGIDSLYDFFPSLGVPFLQAQFPRAYIDPNRRDNATEKFLNEGDQEYHPAMDGLLREKCTPRSDQDIYARKLSLSEVFNRVSGYYRPYHDQLSALLTETKERHGKVVHLNCHSMPSTIAHGRYSNDYDIILGTREGETASPALVAELKTLLEEKGYKVGVDIQGYRGAEIILRSGRPDEGFHSIQVELNRRLYMDEDTLKPLPAMAKLRDDLRSVIGSFASFCDAWQPQAPAPRKKTPAL